MTTDHVGDREAAFTTLLRSDAVMLMIARKAMEQHDSGPAGALAARLALDGELRAASAWPAGEHYLAAAADYDRTGQHEDAGFLRKIAATDPDVDEVRASWNLRYEGRPRTPETGLIASARDAGLIDFDPAGPYPGTDGSSYSPGVLPLGEDMQPTLIVTSRGGSEIITGWPGYAAMTAWTMTRGTTASGPLVPPPGRRDCRIWQEDQVLACLLASPSDAPAITAAVPPDTFTTDVRYDIYQAIVHAGHCGTYTPGDIETALARRMATVPVHGLHHYGGPAAPFARAYLHRLAETPVSRDTAMSTASILVQEDNHCRSRGTRAPGPGHRGTAASSAAGHGPDRGFGLLPAPRSAAPAAGPGPVPRT